MNCCSLCGAERRRYGVLYPARLLCPCEAHACHCSEAAIIVEFQSPMRGKEPQLPPQTTNTVAFFCAEHCPSGFPLEVAKGADKKTEGAKPAPAPQSKRKGKAGGEQLELPNLDPIYARLNMKPPSSALSTELFECAECKHIHRGRERRLWNGSRSDCPKCGERVYTRAWTPEQETR